MLQNGVIANPVIKLIIYYYSSLSTDLTFTSVAPTSTSSAASEVIVSSSCSEKAVSAGSNASWPERAALLDAVTVLALMSANLCCTSEAWKHPWSSTESDHTPEAIQDLRAVSPDGPFGQVTVTTLPKLDCGQEK